MAEFISDTRSALGIDLQRQTKVALPFLNITLSHTYKILQTWQIYLRKNRSAYPGKDMEGNVVAALFRAYGAIVCILKGTLNTNKYHFIGFTTFDPLINVDKGIRQKCHDLHIFIGPESDHCLPLSLTHSLTDWLTDSLLFSKLD